MQEDEQKKSLLKIIAGLAIGFILILAVFRIFAPNSATISGVIRYNGIKPQDPSQGKIVVEERELGQSQYQVAVNNVPLKDNQTWAWENAIEGKTYQIIARLEYQGKTITESSTITVTAPAQAQVLTFNVTSNDIPNSSGQGTVTISGNLNLNGYVPDGSYVNILSREGNSGDFEVLAQGIPAIDGRKMSWNAAKAGVYYTFQGQLFDPNGTNIGTSDNVTVVGPASGLTMTINSSETAPNEKTSISGQIVINGPTQPHSTVLLLEKKPGDSTYDAFDRIPAVSGSTWSFDNAENGQAYEISASLQVNEQDTSVGNVLKVTSPADDQTITINSNFSLNPPSQQPTFSCGNQQNGQWNAALTFPGISNASQYYLQVGTTQGGSDLLSERVNTTGGNIIRNVLVNDGVTNYARYAYTYDTSCNSQQCFSGYSPALTFKCPH